MTPQQTYEGLRKKIEEMTVIEERSAVEKTAQQLREMNYQTPFLLPVSGFTQFNRKEALAALQQIYETPDTAIEKLPVSDTHSPDDIRQKTMEMFVKEFRLLQQLRADLPEAWDHINELYEDD